MHKRRKKMWLLVVMMKDVEDTDRQSDGVEDLQANERVRCLVVPFMLFEDCSVV